MLKVIGTVRPRSLVIAAAIINAWIELGFPGDAVITVGRNGKHKKGSKHYTDEALDWRTHDLSQADSRLHVAVVARRLGNNYDVLLEDEGTPNEHGHAEYDPVKG